MSSIAAERIHRLNDHAVERKDKEKTCILYVMARDQRTEDNFALAVAQEQAIASGVPLAVLFVLQPHTGKRAREHYEFMLAGLRDVEEDLARHDIPFMLMLGKASDKIKAAAYHLKPQAVIFDFNPLRGPQKLHKALAEELDAAVFEVDTHNVVPIWQASDKQEIAARTIRPKINRQLAHYLDEAPKLKKHPHDWPGTVQKLGKLQPVIDELLEAVPANGSDLSRFMPGQKAAQRALDDFVGERLEGYAALRNDPSQPGQSELNPYLHYGQLSSATVVRAVKQAAGAHSKLQQDAETLIEEMVVRKELSDNFCYYNQDYDKMRGAPEWARRTLDKHASDEREVTYTREQFEKAQTHDEAWNAAQRQLVRSGKIHGYMRMYWAKKVLEWSKTPQGALQTLLYLNDFYHIDGGDPNGYVGILWSIAGLHDRPWQERPVYGTIRSMVYNGLKRKFDIQAYIDQWSGEAS